MYLKSIEVQGFKSFANRIVLQFHNGITGIVGPNGSGKSNVADAVRWVLGEQSAKSLRGGNMQDVIFAGTQNRKPLGYAYVAITLDNSDHALKIDFEEVKVSRRLYRSGESEYMINGSQCRLKDINELFYDTGIGKEGYSIIGQGQVEAILNGKPDERRALFDEAAGIVKFKRRKLEAQKKLDDEQQNLIRVNDILSELSRQIGPLERASEKAKVYLKKKEELKAYDVNMFLFEFEESRKALNEARTNMDNANAELEAAKADNEKIRKQYDEVEEAIARLDVQEKQLIQLRSDNLLKKQELEGRISLLREQIRSAKEGEERTLKRAQEIAEEILTKTRDADNLAEIEESLREQEKEISASSIEEKDSHSELVMKISETSRASEQVSRDLMELLSSRSSLQAKGERADAMLEEMRIRKARLDGQLISLQSRQKDQARILDELDQERKQIEAEIDELNAQSNEKNEELSKLQEVLTDANSRLETVQVEYHRESSRLETMTGIAERYDGYGNSIRKVMERRHEVPGLRGVVADLIRTESKYETAIETALGGSIQNIVTDDENTAKRMISYLKNNKFGRATFLPLTAMKSSSGMSDRDIAGEPGVIGIASTLVTADSKYNALIRQLLGRTVVADNIDNATALNRKNNYKLRIVTLDGELLSPGGSMTGGAFKNTSNLLARRRQIDELKKKTEDLKKQLYDLRTTIDNTRGRRNNLRGELVDISGTLQQKFLEKNTADLKWQEAEKLKSDAAGNMEQIAQENADITARSNQAREEKTAANREMKMSQNRETILTEKHQTLSDELAELRRKESDSNSRMEQIRLSLSQTQQKAEYLKNDRNRLLSEVEALKEEKARSAESLKGERGISEGREKEIGEIENGIREADVHVKNCSEDLQRLTEEKEERNKQHKSFFEQREQITEKISLLDREIIRLGNQTEKLDEKQESRISYMWDEYELTYSSCLPLRRDDLGNRADWRRNMLGLKTDIRNLGPVNINAIEEYKEVSTRHDFMQKQHDDLIEAEKALEKIIAQLDDGMRKQFVEQFARIQEEFNKSFKQLFGGGQGALELVEDEDVLEAGVRIIAQPPGKKLVNMMQMSGGEKALTAIALLFAIQNLKPSPFCLLDEIEAALDESNVDRYAAYLHKLTKHTQFIIITHRRGTMAAADRLYGITMQEKGVSTLVSVNLIEDELDK